MKLDGIIECTLIFVLVDQQLKEKKKKSRHDFWTDGNSNSLNNRWLIIFIECLKKGSEWIGRDLLNTVRENKGVYFVPRPFRLREELFSFWVLLRERTRFVFCLPTVGYRRGDLFLFILFKNIENGREISEEIGLPFLFFLSMFFLITIGKKKIVSISYWWCFRLRRNEKERKERKTEIPLYFSSTTSALGYFVARWLFNVRNDEKEKKKNRERENRETGGGREREKTYMRDRRPFWDIYTQATIVFCF